MDPFEFFIKIQNVRSILPLTGVTLESTWVGMFPDQKAQWINYWEAWKEIGEPEITNETDQLISIKYNQNKILMSSISSRKPKRILNA